MVKQAVKRGAAVAKKADAPVRKPGNPPEKKVSAAKRASSAKPPRPGSGTNAGRAPRKSAGKGHSTAARRQQKRGVLRRIGDFFAGRT